MAAMRSAMKCADRAYNSAQRPGTCHFQSVYTANVHPDDTP